MAYESKVIFMMMMDILETSEDLEEAKVRLAKIANVENVLIPQDEKGAKKGKTVKKASKDVEK